MAQFDNKLIMNIARAVCNIAGAALVAFNTMAFTVEKHGSYYFKDSNQTWFAVGVGLLVAGYTIKNWGK